ncbi:MAG: Uncharacterized protein AUREO_013250 [Aureobasidium pullulans]|nr:MAG: Uncharacterized protein AUREO_013250 [Aureobasidium pullulans]THW49553.1 hypothetical protein D6D25_04178 [Aureobasidium pullulans]
MPKNPLKNFARRKSSGNILDLPSESTSPAPASSSFRVLERPDKAATPGSGGYPGGPVKRTSGGRPGSSILLNRKSGKSQEDLVQSANRSVAQKSQSRPHTVYGVLNRGRGSGGTALSGSSGYFDNSSSSARYSSSSTLPSSIEAEHEAENEDLFPRKNGANNSSNLSSNRSSAASNALPEPPSFSARAGRAMSFGLRSKQNASPGTMTAATAHMPDLPENSLIRDRATTMSSNASTAVPPRLDANLGSMSDFGSDFGMNMFEGLSSPRQAKNNVAAPQPAHDNYGRSVRRQQSPGFNNYNNAYQQRPPQQASQPLPAPPAHRYDPTPSPEAAVEPETRHRPANLSAASANRYSWASRTSNDGLMSPAIGSDISSPLMNPPSTFARFRPGYQPVPDRYGSPANETEPEHERADSYSSEEDASRPISRARSPLVESYTAPTSPQRVVPAARNPTIATVTRDDLSSSESLGESQHTTPRANNLRPTSNTSDGMFDHSPSGPTSRAVHVAAPPVTSRTQSQQFSPTKRMTRKEFEAQRREASPEESEESEESEEEGYDDDDEAERQAELARQRRKQEANLSVYRQQMKKVSGGNPSELPSQNGRPSLDRASYSAPGLTRDFSNVSLGAEQEEEDDEVPLGILQAHGFPSKGRPPTRLASAPPTPGSVVNGGMGGGSLPVFARNLPADPYFGAGLVNPSNRESLAFGSGGSVYGGASPSMHQLPQMPQMMPPQQMPGMPQAGGGLVGVIAGEERARAARRVNHNGGATFNANGLPLPGNMHSNMPPQLMPRSNSMMNVAPPQMGPQMGMGGFMPQMPQMPQMMGAEQQNTQQMMQLMFQQTQMMQQMMAMQGGQMQQMPQMPQMNSPQMQNGGFPNMLPNGMQRPMSMGGPNGQQQPGMLGPQGGMHQQRSSTMTNLKPPGYAGSMYDYSLSAPRGGYTPSIAPSERSNVGMPSRYRPVTVEGSTSRTASMTSQSGVQNFAKKNASTGSFLNPNNIPATNGSNVPRTTIKVIDKPKGSPRSPQPRADEEDDDEGWAQLRKKREERKKRGTGSKSQEQTLEELYQGFN